MPWLRRFGIALGVCVFAAWLGAWFFMSEADTRTSEWMRGKTYDVTVNMGFAVEDILLEGRQYTDAETLKAVINIRKGDPIFSFNPVEAKKLVERIDWVKEAHVERRLPDTIFIGLKEREPLALWQKNKKLSLLDSEGKVIATSGLERFKDLIIVIGDQAPERAPAFFTDLAAEPLVFERTEAATFVSKRRWDITLKNGASVKLPEEDVGLALRRLALAQEEDGLLERDITNIDLREPGRIVVKTRPGAVQEYKAGLKIGNNI